MRSFSLLNIVIFRIFSDVIYLFVCLFYFTVFFFASYFCIRLQVGIKKTVSLLLILSLVSDIVILIFLFSLSRVCLVCRFFLTLSLVSLNVVSCHVYMFNVAYFTPIYSFDNFFSFYAFGLSLVVACILQIKR